MSAKPDPEIDSGWPEGVNEATQQLFVDLMVQCRGCSPEEVHPDMELELDWQAILNQASGHFNKSRPGKMIDAETSLGHLAFLFVELGFVA